MALELNPAAHYLNEFRFRLCLSREKHPNFHFAGRIEKMELTRQRRIRCSPFSPFSDYR